MRYVVKKDVRPRSSNTLFTNDDKPNILAGFEFDSVIVREAIEGGFNMVRMPDGYWLPMIYKGIEYVSLLETINEEVRSVPSGITLAIAFTTYQLHGKSRPSWTNAPIKKVNGKVVRQGLPDTVTVTAGRQEEQGYVLLTPELQKFWYDLNVERTPYMTEEEHKKDFNSMTTDDRWQTNRYGSLTCAVYPTGKNLNRPPMRYFPLITGGTVLQIVDKPRAMFGATYYPYAAIDASRPFKQYNPKDHPFLFYEPMNSIREPIFKPNGNWTYKYREDLYARFHQFDYKSITPILMPRSDIGWIEARKIRILREGEPIPQIFNCQ